MIATKVFGRAGPGVLTHTIAASQLRLSPSELARIDEVSRLPAEYPGRMFERQGEYRQRQLARAAGSQ